MEGSCVPDRGLVGGHTGVWTDRNWERCAPYRGRAKYDVPPYSVGVGSPAGCREDALRTGGKS